MLQNYDSNVDCKIFVSLLPCSISIRSLSWISNWRLSISFQDLSSLLSAITQDTISRIDKNGKHFKFVMIRYSFHTYCDVADGRSGSGGRTGTLRGHCTCCWLASGLSRCDRGGPASGHNAGGRWSTASGRGDEHAWIQVEWGTPWTQMS